MGNEELSDEEEYIRKHWNGKYETVDGILKLMTENVEIVHDNSNRHSYEHVSFEEADSDCGKYTTEIDERSDAYKEESGWNRKEDEKYNYAYREGRERNRDDDGDHHCAERKIYDSRRYPRR